MRKLNDISYSQLFDSMSESFVLHKMLYDDDGNPVDYVFLDVNLAYEILTGMSKEKWIGKKVSEINLDRDDYWLDMYSDVAKYGKSVRFEKYMKYFNKYLLINAFSPEKDYFAVTVIDITEQKINEKNLRDEKEKFKSIFEYAPDGICNVSLEGKFMSLNPKMSEILGYSDSELINMTYKDVTADEDMDESSKYMSALIEGEIKQVDLEKRFIRKSGEKIWGRASVSLVKDSKGMPYYFSVILSDITERKNMELLLKRSEERLKRAQEIAMVGDWELDLEARRIWGSDESFKIYGLENIDNNIPYFSVRDMVVDEDRSKLNDVLDDALKGIRDYDIEFKIKKSNSQDISIIHSQAVVLRDENGKPVRVNGIVEDITQRKTYEEALKKSALMLKASIESPKETMVSSVDCAYKYLFFNKAHESMMSHTYGKKIEVGDKVLEKIPFEADRICVEENFSQAMAGISHATIQSYGEQNQYYFETFYNPIYDEDEKIIGATAFARNITDRIESENKIKYLSYHDVLTGLYNRTFYLEELNRLDTPRQLPISIINADINGLKLINDMFGHTKGDELIQSIGNAIKNACRKEDIVARLGGDEFSIILPNTDHDTAEKICKRIYEMCEKLEDESGSMIFKKSLSVGCDTKIDESESLVEISNKAEEMMYKHKLLERNSMHHSIISSIQTTLHEKSHETKEHADRLVIMSKKIGKMMHLDHSQLKDLELLATLHDIGKMGISDAILLKPGKLNEVEWVEMKKHPEIGYRIAQASPELISISEYILCHHEKFDGTGYPQGLKGNKIPLLSRIIAVVDSYDAMTSNRTYQEAKSKEEAIIELVKCSGTQFDPEIVENFIKIIKKGQLVIKYDKI
ncbi:MAG: PAS domain S-box protein [Clostridiales bacterium]|nr:PAS domain S-box protein [Clostridiales bacterium]